jgi:serine/threonine protein kinase
VINNTSDLTGRTLGTCLLEKLIGQGGMGSVYLARQSRPSRYVAVKVLLPRISMSPEVYKAFLARFRREADLIARLEHVNIMPIYEYGEQDGITYLVMPYFPGGSLRDVLVAHGALPLRQTLSYIEQAAAALDYAHAHGVIHRDIKPSNFMLHNDGRLVLADFGIARMMQEGNDTMGATLTGTGMLVGTPEYMAPEMARSEPIDARADIYELGIVLFQMLSGHVPFKGNTPLAVVVKQLEETLPPLHQTNPTIPPAVDRVVQKATAKRREDRYRTAGEMAQALRLAINSPNYPSETMLRSAPTVFETQPGIAPPPPPFQGSQPSVDHAINFATTPASDRPRIENEPLTPGAHISPVTPYPPAEPAPRPGLRPWLLIIAALLIIVLVLGGVFVGLRLGASPAPIPPTATTVPNPTPGTTVAPTQAPPTPTPVPPTPTPTQAPPSPTPSPAQQAQSVVQQYYSDINNKDYQSAYNLWGSAFQNAHSYSSFANGFANTVQDNATISNVLTLSDGTVQVYINLQATDQTSSGTTTSTYQGYYTVGQENGAWKLLSAQINKTA